MQKSLKNQGKYAVARAAAQPRAAVEKLGKKKSGKDVQWLAIAERHVPLLFKQDHRARRIIMRLDYGASRIVVVRPKRTSRHEAKRFVLSNRDWIEQRIDQLPEIVPFSNGTMIPFLGVPHRIRHCPSARGVVWCDGVEIYVAGREEHLARRVGDWLRLEARREIEERARLKAEQIGKKIKRLQLRDTTTRWGSCSNEGELSFSWRLIFAPRHVIDYVVSHEVAHLKEMNHGPRFWDLCHELSRHVTSACQWLEENGTGLYRYGQKA